MKKRLLAVSLLALALGVSACSSKPAETTAAPTTEAAATEAATTEAAATEETTEEEEIEEDYMTGYITAMEDTVLTVKNDEDDTEKKYDISDAEITHEFALSEGDWVEIAYPSETTEDPVPVIALEVLESEIGKNIDPSVEAVLEDVAEDTITIKDEDGESYTLEKSNAYVVSKADLAAGQTVTVTYLGDLDDEAMAVKIVAEDSYDTPEAELFAFTGKVVQINDDEGSIVLESAQGDFFTFVSDEIDFSEYSEGDVITVVYTGTISAKDIPAVEVR